MEHSHNELSTALKQEKQFDSPGFYFQWHFLEACNLRCKHCYQNGYNSQRAEQPLLSKIIVQIQKALDAWDTIGRVSITGGEPLLDIDSLFYILSGLSAVDRVNHLGILTNGTLFTDTIIDKLKVFKKLKEVQVSIDGASASTHDLIRGNGSFDKAICGIKKVITSGIPTAIMFTVSRLNENETSAMIDLADRLGVSAVTIERYTPFHDNGDPIALTPEITKRVFQSVLIRKRDLQKSGSSLKIRTSRPLWALLSDDNGGVCPVGYSCLTIMHDGTVYPCRRLPVSLGTIQNDGLFKIWYTSPILWRLRNRNQIETCAACKIQARCDGCRAAAYADSHDFMGKDPLCWKENLNE